MSLQPRILIILPRGRRFGPEGATSIDLCVRDFVSFSRFRASTTIMGEPIEHPFPNLDFKPTARSPGDSQRLYAHRLANAAAALKPDLVVVHQHMPSAVRIAKGLQNTPVLVHRHNGAKSRKNAFSRWRDASNYDVFAGIIWVSAFCQRPFVADHPNLAVKSTIIHNGIDFAAWTPAAERRREVLFVGRLDAEKGCLEAAIGAARAVLGRSDWSVRFALQRRAVDAAYLASVASALAPLGERARIEFDLTHDAVREAYCSAAIALVPSVFQEPFGRTAIEAFAGGAALITSMRGGLAEVAQGYAEPCSPPTPETIATAITSLIENPARLRALAESGRKHGEAHFDIRAVTARLDDLYEGVLRERSGT